MWHCCWYRLLLLFLYFQSESPTHRPSNNKTPTKNDAHVKAIVQANKFIKSQSPDPSYSLTTSNILKSSNNTTPRKGELMQDFIHVFWSLFIESGWPLAHADIYFGTYFFAMPCDHSFLVKIQRKRKKNMFTSLNFFKVFLNLRYNKK